MSVILLRPPHRARVRIEPHALLMLLCCTALTAGLLLAAATRSVAAAGPVADEFAVGDRAVAPRGWRTSCTDADGNRTSIEQACSGDACVNPGSLVLRRVDAGGKARGPDVAVNLQPAWPFGLRVACSKAGWVAAQWFDQNGCLLHRVFDPDGHPLSAPASAVPADRDCRSRTALVVQDGGSLLATWAEAVADGSRIVARRFGSDTRPTSDGFALSDGFEGWNRQPKLAIDESGETLVAWLADADRAPFAGAVLARFVDADGRPASAAFRVDTFGFGQNSDQAVASNGRGVFEVVWNNVLEGGRVGRLVLGRSASAVASPAPRSAAGSENAPRFGTPRTLESGTYADTPFGRELSAGSDSTWVLEKLTPGYLRSGDDAVNWLDGSLAADDPSLRAVHGTDGAGVWVALRFSGRRPDATFIRSGDNAATWSDPSPLASVPETGDDCDACSVRQAAVRGAPGTAWVAVWSYAVAVNGNQQQATPIGQRIVFSRSQDSGRSWSAAQYLGVDRGLGIGGFDLATDGNGNWVAMWMDGGIEVARSDDDGESWSNPQTLVEQTLCTDCALRWRYHRLKLVHGGGANWLAIFASADYRADLYGHDGDVFVLRSADNGATWSEPVPLSSSATSDGSPDFEPSIAVDGFGRVLAAWTSHRPLGDGDDLDADVVVAMSGDAGSTWNEAVLLDPKATADHAADGAPLLAADSRGRWLAAWRSIDFSSSAQAAGDRLLLSAADATCANGDIEMAEVCDDANTADGDGCDSDCSLTGCGNAIVTDGEECDDGNRRSDDTCTPDCRPTGCGDGVLGPDETCDDGNDDDTDACPNSCMVARCGDGLVHADSEQCDSGGGPADGDCTPECRFASCGDGYLHRRVEACDDGNTVDDDACPNDCSKATCGDGQTAYGIEECDWADAIYKDVCTKSCRTADLCGDANADDRVTTSDALAILQHSVGLAIHCPRAACDMDGTGRISVIDAQLDLRKAVGLKIGERCSIGTGRIVFWIDDPREIAALQFDIDYRSTGGAFAGSGSEVACQTLAPWTGAAFNDDEGERVLTVGLITLNALNGPLDLFHCDFELPEERDDLRFAIYFACAENQDFEKLDPPPLLGYRLE